MKLYKEVDANTGESFPLSLKDAYIVWGDNTIEAFVKPVTLSEIIKKNITEEDIKELIMLSSKVGIVEAHGKQYTGVTTDINLAAKAIINKLKEG